LTSLGPERLVVEVTDTVRQEEPQYQASELLVGAICQGYRIAERPVVMHKRTAGESKKGHNLLYGLRYGRALLRTWWRDRGSGKPAQPETEPRPRRAGIPGLLVDTLAENRLAVIVLGAGAALRGLVFFAYDPFLWVPTSSGYIAAAGAVRPSEAHPWGYSGFLWLTGEESRQACLDPAKREAIADELADVVNLVCQFSVNSGIDISDAFAAKIAKNAVKYPVSG